jgi:hypothetical protein
MSMQCSLMPAILQFMIFWFVAPCSVVGGYQRFGKTYCFYLQGQNAVFSETSVSTYSAQPVRTQSEQSQQLQTHNLYL